MSALVVAAGFKFIQAYQLHHHGAELSWARIIFLLFCIGITLIPALLIESISVGWTYKFMVKVALVNEAKGKQTFLQTRTPAIIVAGTMLLCNLACIAAMLSLDRTCETAQEITLMVGFIAAVFGSSFTQALGFYMLWRCVKDKDALATP